MLMLMLLDFEPVRAIFRWRRLDRRYWRNAIAFFLGLALMLNLASPAPAQAARELRWEDLLPAPTATMADPFGAMTAEQLADLARVEYIRWWLENDGASADEGAIDPSFQQQKLAELEQTLTGQGLDVDALLAQVEVERDRRQVQREVTNGDVEGQLVQLPGYVLPLDPGDSRELRAFLLVPYVGACIHVPPPPPNQMVFVEAQAGVKNPGVFSPVKITGQIRRDRRTYDLFRVDGSRPVTVGYSLTLTALGRYQPEGENLLPRLDELALPEGHSPFEAAQVWTSALFGRTMTRIQEQRSLSALGLGLLFAFGYGVVHTLGPGHGKAVIVSYFVGQGGSLRRGVTMGLRVALFHVLSAVVVAVATDWLVRQALGSAPGSYTVVRLLSYGAIAAIGFWMLQQAVTPPGASQASESQFVTVQGDFSQDSLSPEGAFSLAAGNGSLALSPNLSGAVLAGDLTLGIQRPSLLHQAQQGRCSCIGCGDGKGGWLSLAIGSVPCSGALLVLIYGLANDLLWASLMMVVAISAGMALTLSAIGMAAIWGRETARHRLGSGAQQQRRLQFIRQLAAVAVLFTGTFLFGLTLVSAAL